MRRSLLLPLAVLCVGLALPGCVLISGQFIITYDDFANPVSVAGPGAVYSRVVDLTTIGDYQDHKEDLQSLLDVALVGEVTNNDGSSPVDIQIWLTPGPTSHADAASLQSDPGAVQVWGTFRLASGETRRVGWDESAGLFSAAGKRALITEVKGDGVFTLYLLGATGTYSFTINDPALILVLDAGL
jgi:hypothetical protein